MDKEIRILEVAIRNALKESEVAAEVKRLILSELLHEFAEEANAKINEQLNAPTESEGIL